MTANAHGNFSGKRLVIFGAGYVGAAIAREGLVRGMRVVALTRNEEKAAALRAAGAEVVVADLADHGWHDRIPGGADFVLNCVSSGGGGLSGYERSYLGGMKSIIGWSRAKGTAGTLVYTSSTSVYPQGGGFRVDERAETDGTGERASVLVAAENLLRASSTRDVSHGELGKTVSTAKGDRAAPGPSSPRSDAAARWFILRLAGIYGPGRHHLLEQVKAREVAGRGDYQLNLIHLEDICAAVWSAFQAPSEVKDVVLNVADDGAATKAEITSWIAAQLGIPAPHFSGEPAAGRRAVTPDRIIVNTKLKTMLGWTPRYRSFQEGYASLLRA
ncbi:MAG: NAD-dependent epimerase/dehydratase family protein [Opitutaceae bacterium]